MLKVLAAELSDGGRLGRARELRASGAVLDLDVSDGLVTAQVQGSRPRPYVTTLRTEPGHQVPTRDQLRLRCTCPDDAGGHGTSQACKHVLATLFALADEVAIDPTTLERWRGGEAAHATTPRIEHRSSSEVDSERPGRDAEMDDGAAHDESDRDRDDVDRNIDDTAFGTPGGVLLPVVPDFDVFHHPRLADPLLDEVLRAAIAELTSGWG